MTRASASLNPQKNFRRQCVALGVSIKSFMQLVIQNNGQVLKSLGDTATSLHIMPLSQNSCLHTRTQTALAYHHKSCQLNNMITVIINELQHLIGAKHDMTISSTPR